MKSIELQINRITRLFWFIVAMIIRPLIKINDKRIFCWAYGAKKYACNPRALTEYILSNHADEYEIYWGFNKDVDTSMLDNRIHIVRKYSFHYLYALYSSKFVFYNARNNPYDSMFIKKREQKYIMMWHGPFALKKIEKDACEQLSPKYLKYAQKDSAMCDLMLSNSKFFTKLIHDSFWYRGEILEKCSPRNDVFYNLNLKKKCYFNVRKSLGLSKDCKIVLYAPTFRSENQTLDYYHINWTNVIPYFEKILGGNVEILLRLHPNIAEIKGLETIMNYPHVHDVTKAPDITDFLFAANAMISDYTSAMFDFSLLQKPCFIYAVDKDEYDRGFYWNFEQLPFPFAESEKQLISNIGSFDSDKYFHSLKKFQNEIWGLDEDGHACEHLYNWMKAN